MAELSEADVWMLSTLEAILRSTAPVHATWPDALAELRSRIEDIVRS